MATSKETKIILLKDEAKIKIKNGINKACALSKLTLGPGGSNIIIERQNDFPLITNDGVRIVKRVQLEDEVENMGAELVAKMAENADTVGGDGTTTSTVILDALINKILDNVGTKINPLNKYIGVSEKNPMQIKKEIKESCERVKEKLKEMSREISTQEDIKTVALVSSESEEVSNIIADLFSKLGKEGQIIVDDSNGFGIESEIIEGYQVESGLPSIHYANTNRKFCKLESPLVLITNEKIENVDQIGKIVDEYSKAKNSGVSAGSKIVIFCEDFTVEMLSIFITLKVRIGLTIVPIKIPAFKKGDVFEDICAITGGELIDISKNESITNVGYDADVWGTCDDILIRHKDLIIRGPSLGAKNELIEKIKSEIKDNTQLTQHQINKMKERISKLSSGIGVIRVGAPTRTEQEYLRLKIDDTVNATKAAISSGVVHGGGMSLKKINDELPDSDILKNVINAPYKQIIDNLGHAIDIPETIVDPLLVVQNSLEKACSTASIVITMGGVIATKREKIKPEDELEGLDE